MQFLHCSQIIGALLIIAATPNSGTAGTRTFVHPGILHTQTDLDRMKTKVNAGAQPWKSGRDRLIANSLAQASYTPNPQDTYV